MAASSFQPLITRIGEIMISGSGTSPYTIPTGSFSLEWWYSGLDDIKRLTPKALTTPQAKFEVVRMVDSEAWSKPSNQIMYRVEVEVGLAYYTDAKILKSARHDLETRIGRDVHRINKALSHPGNLLTTNGGTETGLAGGLLRQMDEDPEFEWQPDNSIVAGTLNFTGWLVLSSSV